MNNTVVKSMLGVWGALVLFQAVPEAGAQESGVSEIIVTARRIEERLQDVPISITVFNQQQLNNRNIVNAQDLAAFTPSLSTNNNFGNANSSFAIRGFVQDIGTQPSVGVYFADVVAARGASNNIPIGDGAGPGMFFDLQNVQVLKGPQGTLFGRNTTGGALLVVPQKPTAKQEGYGEVSFGNFGMKRIQAVENLPVSDTVRLRVGVDHQSRDGFLNNYTGIGDARLGDVDYTAVRASLVVDVTPDLENYTILSYLNSDSNGEVQKVVGCNPSLTATNLLGLLACGQLAAEKAQGAGFYSVASTLPSPQTKLTQWQVNNTTTWHASDTVTLKNIASYAQLDEKYRSALFGTNFFFAFPPFIPLPGLPLDFAQSVPLPGGSTAKESTATEELQLQGRALENRLNWQSGIYLEDVEPLALVGSQSPVLLDCTNSDTFNCIAPIGSPPTGPGSLNYTAGKTYFFDAGIYEQATYDLSDQLKVTEGLRYTEDRTHNNSYLRTYAIPQPGIFFCTNPDLVPPACLGRFRETSHAPTWLLGLDYKPVEDVLVYGKYSRGYRAGGVVAGAPTEFTTYKPEKVDTFETGLKTSFKGAVSGTFNIAAFYNNFSDQQLQMNLNPKPGAPVSPASGILNAGKSHIYGLEVESSLNLFPGFVLDASYTYLNTKLVQVTAVSTPANSPYQVVSPGLPGDQLALSPKNKAALTGTYTLPLPDSVGRVALSATLTHTDSMITNYVDRSGTMVVYTPAPTVVPNPAVTSLGTLPALNLLSLDLNWRSVFATHVDLSLFATNVTNKQYYTYVPGLYGTTSFETASLGLPRMYGARLRYSW